MGILARARKGMRWAAAVALLLALATVLQVALVGLVDPPYTWTMISRAREHRAEEGEWRWVDYQPANLDTVGERVPRAVVSSEDGRFWVHGGFDLQAVRDALSERERRGTLRGGSTITQQAAKNLFLWQGRSWVRKGLEAWYALWMELLLPKDRILELYLSVAETGPMTFGVEAGAQHHFGAPAAHLSADEAGRLAGILPNPREWPVSGKAASTRTRWIARNPAPFPGDPGWEAFVEATREGRGR